MLGQSPLPGKVRLTCEFTRSRKRAKPAVASRVQRRVRPHGCSEALGRVACPKFMAMKKVDAERTSSFALGCAVCSLRDATPSWKANPAQQPRDRQKLWRPF